METGPPLPLFNMVLLNRLAHRYHPLSLVKGCLINKGPRF